LDFVDFMRLNALFNTIVSPLHIRQNIINHSQKKGDEMGTGFLKVQLYVGDYTLHGQQMAVLITKDGRVLQTLETDENGATGRITLDAPDLTPDSTAAGEALFATYDVIVPEANGYKKVSVYGVQIFDGITSILNINMEPLSETGPQEIKINVPRERGAANGTGTASLGFEEQSSEVFRQNTPSSSLHPSFDMITWILILLLLKT